MLPKDARLELVRAQRCDDLDVAFLASAILGRDSTPPSIRLGLYERTPEMAITTGAT
jgi:hypothetical protein